MKFVRRVLYAICVTCRPNRSRTVRYAFPALFTTASLLVAATILSQGTSYIRLEISDTSVEANTPFSIDVYAGAHVPVNAIDITVQYPENQIEVTGIDTGESVITIWTQEPYFENGEVIFRGGTFRNGFAGEHLIGTINAVALKSGTATFGTGDIQFLAGDGEGTNIEVQGSDTESMVVYVENEEGLIEATASVQITTDIDGDGLVTLKDVSVFMSAWFLKDNKFDFNNDRRMNFTDFAIILSDSFFK